MAVFLRTEFNYDVDLASKDAGYVCVGESQTVQSEAEDADINVIVQRFGLTGKLPENVRMPASGDFTGIGDFHAAVALAQEANQAFMRFPVEVRRRFDHDPQQMMMFLEDPRNRVEAESLGLVVKNDAGAALAASTASPSPAA